MLPDWKKCTQINFGPEASYTAKSNGYLFTAVLERVKAFMRLV